MMPYSAAFTLQSGTFNAATDARHHDALRQEHDDASGGCGGVDDLVRGVSRREGARLPAAIPKRLQPKRSVGAACPGSIPKCRTFGCSQMAYMCYLCWLHVSAILAVRYG